MLTPVTLMQVQFHDRIAQLVFTFPEDATTSAGNLFWSAPKRFPRAIGFDAQDPVHASFAQAAAVLKAQSYRLPIPDWAQSASKVCCFAPPEYMPNPQKHDECLHGRLLSTVFRPWARQLRSGGCRAQGAELPATHP